MSDSIDKKEGELSSEEAALAKKFFVALAFVVVAVSIVGLESFIDLPFVMFGVIAIGVAAVLRSSFKTGKDAKQIKEVK